MPVRLAIGDCVLVRTSPEEDIDTTESKTDPSNTFVKQGIGLIKYIGHIHGQQHAMKQYVGIELIEPITNGHDGNINGFQYFTAQRGCGIHVLLTSILCKLSVSEMMSKLKDILKFFRTKLSQYIHALHDRDEYIEKLKIKIKTTNTTNYNINTSYPKLKIQNDSSNKSYSYSTSFNNSTITPLINPSFKLTTTNIVINKLLTETRKNQKNHQSTTHNKTRQSHRALTPITPMTPLDTQTSFKSIDTLILSNMNINNNTPSTTITTNIMKDNNSNSYPSTATTTRTSGNSNTCTVTTQTNTGTSTYTNNTINSNRAVLPIIKEPKNFDMNKSRKILEFDNNNNELNTPSSVDNVNKTYYSDEEDDDDDDDDESTTYYSSHKSLSYSNIHMTDDDTIKNNNINISNPNTPNNNIMQLQNNNSIKYMNYPSLNQIYEQNNNNINQSFKLKNGNNVAVNVPIMYESRSFHYSNNNHNNSNSNHMLQQPTISYAKSAEYIPQSHYQYQNHSHGHLHGHGHTHVMHNNYNNNQSINGPIGGGIWKPDTPSLSEPVPNANVAPINNNNNNNNNTSTNQIFNNSNVYQPVLKYYANSQQSYIDINNIRNNKKEKHEKHVKFHKSSIKKNKHKTNGKSNNTYSHKNKWTESYENNNNNNNNNDELIDVLEKQGFVISAQYMYDD